MAYDLKLASRMRELLAGRKGVTEKAMFGGVAWLKGGRMFVGIVGDELMARVGPEAHDEAVARPHARIMDFTGRPMRGYVFVAQPGLRGPGALGAWLDQCERYVASLPEKKARKKGAWARGAARGRGR
jgi:TfoX/Sxy family transcriptional regulator of competence genes